MFGYIVPHPDQLNEAQKKRYQACYCGVCRALKDSSGHSGRLTLSHDMTFLAILLSSLYEPDEQDFSLRCPVHPLRKRSSVSSPMFSYAADMNTLLMYYKCLDKIRDDHSAAASLAEKKLKPAVARISEQHPSQAALIGQALNRLWEEEKTDHPDADLLCNLSGEMLGAAFVPDPRDYWSGELQAVGEGLGRFVYWMDAYDDLKRDMKSGCFNPLAQYRDRNDFEIFCRDTLELFISEATAHFENLPLEKDLDLLRNVLYSGVWLRWEQMHASKKGKEVKEDEQ